jgi:epsilon-lactone hydrolase
VLLTLRQRGLPQPGGVVLMCPWVDLELKLRSDEAIRRSAEAYLGGHPADDPIASPLRADLTGLAPMLIQAATGDERLPDAQFLADRAREHGVDVELELYSVDAHVFQLFWSFLPEAAEALKSAGEFARRGSSPAQAARPARS